MADWSVPVTAAEMYGQWHLPDEAIDSLLEQSRRPMAADQLYDLAGGWAVGPDSRVLDIGCRDVTHGLELVRRYGCRLVAVDPSSYNLSRAEAAVAAHPSGDLVDIRAGVIEAIPADDGCFDVVWCRDVLSHIADIEIALAECHRVLVTEGIMIVYQTFATPWLEPGETARLCAGLAVQPERLSAPGFEAAVDRAGFDIVSTTIVGSQWREAWEEDGTGRTSRQLLQAARLIGRETELVKQLGQSLYKVELANALWGVYQMIGKLEPRIYVLERRPVG